MVANQTWFWLAATHLFDATGERTRTMIAALMLATAMHGHCQIEYRDRTVVHPGSIAQFEVGDTCTMHGLTVVAVNKRDRIKLTGVNRKHGNDLTVSIRIPCWVKDDTILYPTGYADGVVVRFAPVTVT